MSFLKWCPAPMSRYTRDGIKALLMRQKCDWSGNWCCAAIEDAAVDQQSCVLFSTAVHLLQWRNRRRRSRQAELCSISLKRSSHFLLRRSFLLRCSAVEEERRNRKGISSSIAAHFSIAALRSRGGVPQFERFYTLPIYNASKTNKKYLQFL